MKRLLFLVCLAAAFAPFLTFPTPLASTSAPLRNLHPSPYLFPNGVEITPPAASHPFAAPFPGTLLTGRDPHGPFLIREVATPTRALHSSYDCFRGSGYTLGPQRVERDAAGRQWAVFQARRTGETLEVSELFIDSRGQSWTDVSSWYWSALLRRSEGPWQAVTRITPIRE